MAVIQLAGLLLVLALTRPWARRLPTWLAFPVWVGTGLLFQVVVGAVLAGASSASGQGSKREHGRVPAVGVRDDLSSFAGQGAALAIAFGCHVRARWGRRAGRANWRGRRQADRPGAVVAGAPPDGHGGGRCRMAAVVAVVCGYWAAGGSFESGALPDAPWGLQASRAIGAVTAAVGLLGLAGRWGRRSRVWLPAALTWVGSGAMAAFDGLGLTLFLLLGTDASADGLEPDRHSPADQGSDRGVGRCCRRPSDHSRAKDNHLQRAVPDPVETRPVDVAAARPPANSSPAGSGPTSRARCSSITGRWCDGSWARRSRPRSSADRRTSSHPTMADLAPAEMARQNQ